MSYDYLYKCKVINGVDKKKQILHNYAKINHVIHSIRTER